MKRGAPNFMSDCNCEIRVKRVNEAICVPPAYTGGGVGGLCFFYEYVFVKLVVVQGCVNP